MDWLFIDDSKEDRDAFAHALSDAGRISIRAISASEARRLLADSAMATVGVLMDIDLSNESASKESGLGLTADIRAAQHREVIPSFPIVRFSYRDKVAQNIGRDTSSDHYFDLKIDKDRLIGPGLIPVVQQKLAGVAKVYAAANAKWTAAIAFALDPEHWASWGSTGFGEQLQIADRDYVRARLIVQALAQPGMLISEDYLATRLGIDRMSPGWATLCGALAEFRYAGVAAHDFPRWWARGVETWWEDLAKDAPLAATPIADRHRVLSSSFADLVPLAMPYDSPGERPWRSCELTMEETGCFLPLDPSRAVRFRLRSSMPEWLDPTYAALGPAIKHAEDPRLDQTDLKRLKPLIRKG